MKTINFENSFFKNNRNMLINNMLPKSIVILFSANQYIKNGDQYFKFRQNSNFFYFSGINQEESILMIPNIESKNTTLFIKETNKKEKIWNGEKLTVQEAADLSGISNVMFISEFENMLKNIENEFETIYFINDFPIKTIDFFNKNNRTTFDILKNSFPNKDLISLEPIVEKLRLIKKDVEIDAIKKAVEITKKAYLKVLKTTSPNKYEYEIEAEITYEFIRNGADGHAYEPIVASGINTCILHYVDANKIMQNGDLLLLDFGAEYANFAADCSRTIPVNGKFTQRQKDCYNAVLEVLERAKKLYVPGNNIENINKIVGLWLQEKMIDLKLFTKEDVENNKNEEPLYKKYFMHGVAHFMGLDVHDVGKQTTTLEKGMVLTCEPAIYIEEGVGIRIETNIIVDDNPIDLMKDFIISVDEIELAMKK